eukprot:103839_1
MSISRGQYHSHIHITLIYLSLHLASPLMAQYLANELQPIAPLHTFSKFFNKVGNDRCASFLKCVLQYIRCHSTFNLIHVQHTVCSHYLNDSSNHSIVLNRSFAMTREIPPKSRLIYSSFSDTQRPKELHPSDVIQ